MLAWVHQTTASEHEFLVSLFDVKEAKRMVGSVRDMSGAAPDRVPGVGRQSTEGEGEDEDSEEKLDFGQMLRDCLDKDLEGLGRPLKVSTSLLAVDPTFCPWQMCLFRFFC
jgi:hypothetical protein